MNTTSIAKPAVLSLGLLFAILLPSSAMAGSGPRDGASPSKPKTDAAAKAPTAPANLCADSKVVASTSMKPAMPNGKGPLVAVQTGTKTVCHTCPVTTLTTRSSFGNGKGPITLIHATKTGPEHDCTNCVGNPAKT